MKKEKAEAARLWFYEIPQNEPALAILGGDPGRDTALHFHNLLEIGYCRSGAGTLLLDGKKAPYRPGALRIVPPYLLHCADGDGSAGRWDLLFLDPAQLARELYPGDEPYQKEIVERLNTRAALINCGGGGGYGSLETLVRMILEEMRERRLNYRDSVKGLLLALATELMRMNMRKTDGPAPERSAGRSEKLSKIGAALAYLDESCGAQLRVGELADICHMSETHFRREFETCMNMSPADYRNLVRVQRACALMRKTNDSMDLIAQKAGFSSISTFNRNFRKFLGVSPYQWKINPGSYERTLLTDEGTVRLPLEI